VDGGEIKFNPALPTTVDDNLVVGPQTTEGGSANPRLFFVANGGAFRAGRMNGAGWNEANRGARSVVFCSNNECRAADSGVVCGQDNFIAAAPSRACIGGGNLNSITDGQHSVIVAGSGNNLNGTSSAIGGGETNSITGARRSAIICGFANEIDTPDMTNNSVIVCGSNNKARRGGVVGGGTQNQCFGQRSVVICGDGNQAVDPRVDGGGSVLCGNANGMFTGITGTVHCTVCAGSNNRLTNDGNSYSSILCGDANEIRGGCVECAVLNGQSNVITSCTRSIVGGGTNSSATSATGAKVFGTNASSGFDNTFVWGDGSAALSATTNRQWSQLNSGGAFYYSNANGTAGVSMAAGTSSWTSISDVNRKKDLRLLSDDEEMMDRLRRLPVYKYKMNGDKSANKISPTAQDWLRAFPAFDRGGELSIGMNDMDAVKLLAVKNLIRRVKNLKRFVRATTLHKQNA